VRIWAGLEDDDPSSQCVGEQALTVVHKVSTGKNVLAIFIGLHRLILVFSILGELCL
jgi:hypothetical protein